MRNTKLMLILTVLFLVFFVPGSLFGQDILTYSDSWMDIETGKATDPPDVTVEPEADVVSEVFMVGSGVVEIISEKIHTVDTQVTMRSPQGRSEFNSGAWVQGSQGTSLTVMTSILLKIDSDPPDVGRYENLVQHFPTCPESHPPVEGGGSIVAGLSLIALERESWTPIPPFARFRRVQPCNVRCAHTVASYATPRPSEIILPCIRFPCAWVETDYVTVCARYRTPVPAAICTCTEISTS